MARAPLHIIHFNDVYSVETSKRNPYGAARFGHLVEELQGEAKDALVLFSGDALSPSLLSTATKGKHMIPVLNALGVAAACVGNHDLDFGIDVLERRLAESSFPWLLSNCADKDTGEPLAGAQEWTTLTHHGWKIGFMGLIEREWLATLAHVEPEDVDYEDYVAVGRRLATFLRDEQNCDIVIALTHMRVPNDERATRDLTNVDLVLGGHDHHYQLLSSPDGRLCAKSGTDFRELTELWMSPSSAPVDIPDTTVHDGPRFRVASQYHAVAFHRPELPSIKDLVDKWSAKMKPKLAVIVGETGVPIDALFKHIRTRETNSANWVADIAREGLRADVAILNAGTLRADRVIGPGEIALEDLLNLIPATNPIVKIALSGAALLKALENGVSKYPSTEGRFPCVSGLRFQFDATRPPQSRVLDGSVTVGDKPLDLSATYSVATTEYLSGGNDGYLSFKDSTVLVGEECAPHIKNLIRTRLRHLKVLDGFGRPTVRPASRAANKAATTMLNKLKRSNSTHTVMDLLGDEPGSPLPGSPALARAVSNTSTLSGMSAKTDGTSSPSLRRHPSNSSLRSLSGRRYVISPVTDGRIERVGEDPLLTPAGPDDDGGDDVGVGPEDADGVNGPMREIDDQTGSAKTDGVDDGGASLFAYAPIAAGVILVSGLVAWSLLRRRK